jgi:hypothetical protein
LIDVTYKKVSWPSKFTFISSEEHSGKHEPSHNPTTTPLTEKESEEAELERILALSMETAFSDETRSQVIANRQAVHTVGSLQGKVNRYQYKMTTRAPVMYFEFEILRYDPLFCFFSLLLLLHNFFCDVFFSAFHIV